MLVRKGRILEMDGKFYVTKGNTYFCFFVDGDRASYSQKPSHASAFGTEEAAEKILEEVRRRENECRTARRLAQGD